MMTWMAIFGSAMMMLPRSPMTPSCPRNSEGSDDITSVGSLSSLSSQGLRSTTEGTDHPALDGNLQQTELRVGGIELVHTHHAVVVEVDVQRPQRRVHMVRRNFRVVVLR